MNYSAFAEKKGEDVMKKKVLAGLLALSLVLGTAAALPQNAFVDGTSITASAVTTETFTYQLSSDGKFALVTGFNKPSETTCTIPETLGGVPVEVIAQEAFKDKTNLQSVTFPSKLRNIAVSAFEGCTKLERVTIPNSVTTIGVNAFDQACTIRCKSGTPAQSYAVLNGNPIEYISGDFVFKQLKNNKVEIVEYSGEDTNLTIPSEWSNNTVTSIAAGVFKDCTDLKRVTIPRSVEDIGSNAFDKSCTIIGYASSGAMYYAGVHGNKVEYISGNFVYKVLSDNTVEITEYHGEDAALTIPAAWGDYPVSTIGMRVFENNAKLTSVTISDSVTTIKDNAFVGCANLVSATIPKTVTKIGLRAFGYVYGQDSMPVVNPDFTVKCYKGSAADTYAQNNKLKIEYVDVKHVAAKAPTCASRGNIEYWTWNNKYFSDALCNTEITKEDTYIKALGHNWGEPVWTWNGVESVTATFTCARDPSHIETFENVVPTSETTPATCEKDGATVYTARVSLNGKPYTDTKTVTIPKTGHKWSEWKTTKAPTTKTEGEETRTCSVCKKTETRAISKIVVEKQRIAGDNRFGTAAEIAKKAYPSGAKTVILANGMNYADALAGVPLASKLGAPILLTAKDSLPKETTNALEKLGAKKVIILGGKGAVGESVEITLNKQGITTERYAGTSRFGTATAIAEKLNENPTDVFFVYYNGFPDALSASTAAALKNAPIIYLTTDGDINADTAAYLAKLKKAGSVKNAYIIGGNGVITDNMLKKVGTALGVTPKRLYGDNRYDTCVAVNNEFKSVLSGNSICLATGADYPDALAGGVFAAIQKAPLFLINGKVKALNLSDKQKAYLKTQVPTKIYTFGGIGVVPNPHVTVVENACG